jgi:hypothetical protein
LYLVAGKGKKSMESEERARLIREIQESRARMVTGMVGAHFGPWIFAYRTITEESGTGAASKALKGWIREDKTGKGIRRFFLPGSVEPIQEEPESKF